MSVASAKRSTRSPSARAISGFGDQSAGGEALEVDGDLAGGRVLEVLRQAAHAEGHVLHLDLGGLQPVEDEEAVPAAGVAEVDVQHAGVDAVRPPGTGSTTAGPRGSPSVPMSVRSRRKLSGPVSSPPVSFSAAPAMSRVSMRRPPAAGLTPATLTVLEPAKKSRNWAGTSGASPPEKSAVKPSPSSLDAQRHHALGDAVAGRRRG